MKKYTFLFFLGLVASLFTACSDDDNLTDSITPAPESENFFANGMTFASQPGVRSITFTAGRAWQAALDEPGANNCKMKQLVHRNSDPGRSRNCYCQHHRQ